MDASNDGWQTVASRRTAVPRGSAAFKPSGTGYVPPSLRGATAAAKPSSLNDADFPSLGGGPKVASAWGSKTSFAQKVNDLIANEQRTEAEKEAEREAAKEMEGWEVLSLCFDKERYRDYAQIFNLTARIERMENLEQLVADSVYSGYKGPMQYTTDYDALNDHGDMEGGDDVEME